MGAEPGAGPARSSMVDEVAERIRQVTGAARSAVVFGEHGNNDIHFVAATGEYSERIRGARGPSEGSGLCGNVLEGNCSILSEHTVGDERVRQDHAVQWAITTALGVPVHHDGHPFAVLMALNREDGASFTRADQGALERYAEEVADALWPLAVTP